MELYSDKEKKEIEIYRSLKKVIDPELGVNIIDLGLVYKITYESDMIHILMTLSTRSCPLGEVIQNDIKEVLAGDFNNCKVEIEMTWDPEWNSDFITPAGRSFLNGSKG